MLRRRLDRRARRGQAGGLGRQPRGRHHGIKVSTSRISFGARMARVEDPALLTGKGRFIDDIALPGTLSAVFVRSPRGRGVAARSARATGGDAGGWTSAPDID